MIGRIQGLLVEKDAPDVLVNVGGVFYEIQVPLISFANLPSLNHEVTLHTHFAVSETSQQLFGFSDKRERELFRTLIKVNGIGPKLGLSILSGMSADDIVRVVKSENPQALTKLPGVGKKTAERLYIDLRDRLKDWNTPAGQGMAASNVTPMPAQGAAAEAESALIALGYKPAEAQFAINTVLKTENITDSAELIRQALRGMVKQTLATE